MMVVGEMDMTNKISPAGYTFFFYRQLDFSSEPGVANEILENEAKSCLKWLLSFTVVFYTI